METPTAQQIAVSLPFLYAFFAIIGANPSALATYYVGNPWFGWRISRVGVDRTFALRSFGPLLYTVAVIVAEQMNVDHCSMSPVSFISWQTFWAGLTIFLVGRILFGPVLEVRKSVQIVGEMKLTRPFSFMLYDVLTALPFNLITGLAYKWVFIGSIAAVIWLLVHLGIISASHSFISFAVILPWVLMLLGRLSGLMVTFQVPHLVMTVVYLGSILMLAFVWWHTELLLRSCGVQANVLPSYGALIGGLFR